MSEQMSLGGILDGSPAAPPAAPAETIPAEAPAPAPAEPTAPVEAAPDRARGPDGKFVAKEAAPEAPAAPVAPATPAPHVAPQQDMTPKERAFLAQAMDERRKRQDLERQLAERTAAPKEPPKAFWDDPEAALKQQQAEVQKMVMDTRLNTAESIARSKYADFDEKVAVFAEILQNAPGLNQQWLASPDPAEFAYRTGQNHQQLRQAGDLPTMRAQIEKETRLKVEAEFKAKFDAELKQRAALPGSLSDARGTRAQGQTWNGPSTLDSILGKA